MMNKNFIYLFFYIFYISVLVLPPQMLSSNFRYELIPAIRNAINTLTEVQKTVAVHENHEEELQSSYYFNDIEVLKCHLEQCIQKLRGEEPTPWQDKLFDMCLTASFHAQREMREYYNENPENEDRRARLETARGNRWKYLEKVNSIISSIEITEKDFNTFVNEKIGEI